MMKTKSQRGSGTAIAVIVGAVCLWMGGSPVWGEEEEGDYRAFTNKEGNKIEARVVSVAPDRKTARMIRRDGSDFTFEIVLLSLDDQQYLREWLASRKYHLEVIIEKTMARNTERRRDSYKTVKLNTEFPQYRIRVRNLDRETATGPKLEYFLVRREMLRIYQSENRKDWYYGATDQIDAKREMVRDLVEMEDLVFNREQVVTTDPIEIDRVLGEGNAVIGEDELIGMIVQIRDRSDHVIGTWRSSEPRIGKVKWEDLMAVPGESSAPVDPMEGADEPVFVLQGQSLEGDAIVVGKRPFVVSAKVTPDNLKPDGVIASQGGGRLGWVLMVEKRQLIFAVRNGGRVSKLAVGVPDGRFTVKAALDAEKVTLGVEGGESVSAASPGLLEQNPIDPLSVGFDGNFPVLDTYEKPFTFEGKVSGFSIQIGRVPQP